MPEPKIYGTEVPFTDYAWKEMNDIIARGLTFGVTVQNATVEVFESVLSAFTAGNMNDLAAVITSHAGMTLRYGYISWDETFAGAPEGINVYLITNLKIGFVVTANIAGNGNSVYNALDYVDWYHNFMASIPAENFAVYILDPCPTNYHWDATSKKCVLNPCPDNYHWDADVQTCILDTPLNCPTGKHWDETLNRCVSDDPVPQNNGSNFPWIPVIAGISLVSIAGIGGYYYFKRRKRQKTRLEPPILPP